MKILTAAQIREADAYTIQNEPVSSYQLMERAAHACFEWIKKHFNHTFRFDIICGPGNNGGDGLAIARMLLVDAYKVKVYLLRPDSESSLSRDADKNYKILHQLYPDCIRYVQDPKDLSELEPGSVLLDCVFGTGLNRTVEAWYASCIDALNAHQGSKIAIDLPSGLLADHLPVSRYIFRADHTLSFQVYKRSFLHPESKDYTGEVHILDIRLSADYLSNAATENYVIDESWVKQHFRKRKQNTHKGNFGHVAIIAGSYGMMGASVLSCQAALRSGCGLVTGIVPEKGIDILQVSVPEVMCSTSGKTHCTHIPDLGFAGAIGIGPGLGQHQDTKECIRSLLEGRTQGMVIDADALNIVAAIPHAIASIPSHSILTPHPKEFQRLFPGDAHDSLELVEHAKEIAIQHQVIIVLKNNHTAVLLPDGTCWYNITGNAGMATAGSGDVLTGMITSLAAQGYEPSIAAMLGVYIHGKAGDFAAAEHTQESMTSGDIIAHLKNVFSELNQ